MIKLRSGQKIDPLHIAAEVDRLQRLATDLMLFSDGHLNMETDAPLLDLWTQSTRNAACLIGKVYNHPTIIGAGRPTMTSDLCLLDEDMGVARTASRWYRLGRPLGSDSSS